MLDGKMVWSTPQDPTRDFLLCIWYRLELATFKFSILEMHNPIKITFCELSKHIMTIPLAKAEIKT